MKSALEYGTLKHRGFSLIRRFQNDHRFPRMNPNQIHILSAGLFSMLAFYFLGQKMLMGWIFQSLAGSLYTLYFWRQKLPIMATVILGAEAILPIYGIYKWSTSVYSFTKVDGIILGITTLFVLYIGYRMFTTRKGELFYICIEFSNALLYILATLILIITKSVFAWWIFLAVFMLTLILVYERKEWIAVGFQIGYIALAIFAILS